MPQVDRDLVFATHDGLELALDIYHAPRDDAPVTVYVHGGGWRSGDKADDGPRRLAPLSAYGVTVVSVNYRLAPGAVFPSQLRESGAVRADIDAHAIATICFGSYFAAFYRGEDSKQIPERVVAVLWPGIALRS